jgi:hypothetical protein
MNRYMDWCECMYIRMYVCMYVCMYHIMTDVYINK